MNRRSMILGLTACASSCLLADPINHIRQLDNKNLLLRIAKQGSKINRKVLGLCAMRQPFGSSTDICRSVSGSSVRLWQQSSFRDYKDLANFLEGLSPELCLGFNENIFRREPVEYNSQNNNLTSGQQPTASINSAEAMLNSLAKIDRMPSQDIHWETWNEPQFKPNGAWRPEEYADYVNECARISAERKLPLKIGAALHMDFVIGNDWNKTLCDRLDVPSDSFLVTHYYNLGWSKLGVPLDNTLRRAGYGSLLRQRIERDNLLISAKADRRNWSLHVSEWNVHPPSYGPPFSYSTDIGAALYLFDAVKSYLETGVESAQFFIYRDKGHFTLMSREDPPRMSCTARALIMLGDHLHGSYFPVTLSSPEFIQTGVYGLDDAYVPFVSAMAARTDNGAWSLLLANKHPETEYVVQFDHSFSVKNSVQQILRQGLDKQIWYPSPTVDELKEDYLRVPPRSIVALSIS